jgi:tetratricopeptide (TPR) repeat protein
VGRGADDDRCVQLNAGQTPAVRRFVAVARLVLGITAVGLAACGGGSRSAPTLEEKPVRTRLLFTDAAGRELTAADLEGVPGQVRWETIGAGAIPAEASRLHAEAREAGGRDNYPRALDLLEQAHRLAPDWPYPVYDTAFTHLLQGDSAKAEERYAEVDRMVPRGFFTAKTSLDCLRRERAGVLFPGFCQAFATLEWMDDKAKKTALLEGIVEKFPAFPPAWMELSSLLEDEDARLRAITRGLEHDPDPETKGGLLINRALVLHRRGDREGAIKILGELALDPESTLSTEMLAKAILAEVVR